MNTTYTHNDHPITLAIIISLLLHAGLIFYLIAFNNNNHTPKPILENKLDETHISQDTEWVETKTRAHPPGAPVFFQEYDNNASQAADNCPDQTKEEQNSEQSSTDLDEETPKDSVPEQKAEKELTFLQRAMRAKQNTNRTPASHTISSLGVDKRTPQPTAKKLPSLAQLTHGMMNYMNEHGNNAVSMLGKKSGKPTDEQLKYERYLERLNQCFGNSFAINEHKQPFRLSEEAELVVFLQVNRDGTLYNLKLVKSCGNRTADLFVLSVLRDASSSFPPVPSYLPEDPFGVHYLIKLGPGRTY